MESVFPLAPGMQVLLNLTAQLNASLSVTVDHSDAGAENRLWTSAEKSQKLMKEESRNPIIHTLRRDRLVK